MHPWLPNPYCQIVKALLQLPLQEAREHRGVFSEEAPTAQEPASVETCQVPPVPPHRLANTSPFPPSPVLFMVRSSICSLLWHQPQFGPCCATQSCCSISGGCDSLVPLRTHNLLRIVVCYEHAGTESKLDETCTQ